MTGDYCECCDPDVLWCRNRVLRQNAEATEWRAAYLEREARIARAAAAALRREFGLPATPAPRGAIPNHRPSEFLPVT